MKNIKEEIIKYVNSIESEETLNELKRICVSHMNIDEYLKEVSKYTLEPMYIRSYNSETHLYQTSLKGGMLYILISRSYLYVQEHTKDFLEHYKGNRLILTTNERIDGLGSTGRINIATNENEYFTMVVPNYQDRDNLGLIFKYCEKIIANKEYREFIDVKKVKALLNEVTDVTHTDIWKYNGKAVCEFCEKPFTNNIKAKSVHKNRCKKIPEYVKKDKKFKNWYTVFKGLHTLIK